ncbi:Rv0361 family membrane protein [Mycolicibacterium grossiae]|uniref:DUF8174 domain-containing protein n=1 Tax=Mycolicibacterium grossiae TaxID=1552759 RepID=A0A1E8PX00_9MYCO|nr:hypothetical protein [Mycolicibacterium grossiae]OFJ50637.1 hypothetical protein BEL07_27135 [Mycolicibacterium grossiae]QEM47134.1 hypothetical protein FZ046_22290 [Mycolicibacterium grossiae]
MAGPFPYPESPHPESAPHPPPPPFPPSGAPYGPPGGYGPQVPSPYPGALPPPVPYPKRSRRRPVLIGMGALAVVIVAAVVASLLLANRSDDDATGALTPDRAKTAIQDYLTALTEGDDETIARNASCGVFDEIKDRGSDMSLANLASDAFRRQYKTAQVTSIDKVVAWSPNQAQVLFTMQVQGARTQGGSAERQALAQILTQGDDVLVCSYLPRTGQF